MKYLDVCCEEKKSEEISGRQLTDHKSNFTELSNAKEKANENCHQYSSEHRARVSNKQVNDNCKPKQKISVFALKTVKYEA